MNMDQLALIDEPISWEHLANLHAQLDAADARMQAAKEEKKEADAAFKKASDLAQRHVDADTGEVQPG